MRAADFTRAEFAALNASLRASNGLAQLELEVMDASNGASPQGVDAAYFADVHPDYRRLVDAAYLAEKGVIMAAIGRFIALVERAHAERGRGRAGRQPQLSPRRSRSSR